MYAHWASALTPSTNAAASGVSVTISTPDVGHHLERFLVEPEELTRRPVVGEHHAVDDGLLEVGLQAVPRVQVHQEHQLP